MFVFAAVTSFKHVSAFCDDLRDHSTKCVISIVGITVLVVLLIAGVLIMLLWLYDSLTFKTLKSHHDDTCTSYSQPFNPISIEGGHTDSDNHHPSTTTTSSSSNSSTPRMRRRGKCLIVNEMK
uniref:Uncharacterized protein n=1 Tax=Panagrolaimus superbus TaxID=310955 RepID=A0A914Z0E4_9BILA